MKRTPKMDDLKQHVDTTSFILNIQAFYEKSRVQQKF